jgi:hypothetical protein
LLKLDFLANPYTIFHLLIDFTYLAYIYIQLQIFNLIKENKGSKRHIFYRETAIGRRIAYKKFGIPNSVMWVSYSRRYNFNQAIDRVKYFQKKELIDTGIQENIDRAKRIKTERKFYL